MLRLTSNGNLYIYTYIDLPGNNGSNVWLETFSAFSRERGGSECSIPEKCGSFGLCEDNQCVACPTPNGLLGWNKKCKLPKIPSCNNASTEVNLGYFRVKEVGNYLPLLGDDIEGEGPMTISECMEKCSNDCKCVGFFYRYDWSKRCWISSQLNTMTRRGFTTFVDAYIKYAK
ncbi:hypothetical protein MKW94_008041 [Papaver nudicaule]|uniref:Apple domain-containing protein n=1 Tax=Papaver nudicaule TaxID=74823 RepID=A0AA41VID0_PAPNU|nr:hypothetical protein [Papaver nudicaule]